ncbi:zinc ABC transporter permease [Microlunatus endophyticus]|uniref:Zinc ABC transporter permease n=1 Tax=Microlunatus endophyticus TaxID=1716077 RepID=A0A917S3U1_9ACTN|nr:metal ABC transporter permease [Microlunatus endophyticus]GGL56132.1 zinc ABC transporter permease [Microlunatus endophyticus]
MFSGFMIDTWLAASMVAIVAGVVGFFVVLRGSAFAAHAIPQGAFAGAAGADLIGVNPLLGLGVFAVASALGIGSLSRRGRHDVVAALVLVLLLGLGSLFVSWNTEYGSELFALLFGEVLGVNNSQLPPTMILAAVSLIAIGVLFRPLLLASTVPDVAAARGLSVGRVDLAFLVVVALATTMTLPVVGALLIFSLMIGPPAAARSIVARPLAGIGLSVGISLLTLWISIAAAYHWNLPVGFLVGTLSGVAYGVGRGWTWARRRSRPTTSSGPAPAESGRLRLTDGLRD